MVNIKTYKEPQLKPFGEVRVRTSDKITQLYHKSDLTPQDIRYLRQRDKALEEAECEIRHTRSLIRLTLLREVD